MTKKRFYNVCSAFLLIATMLFTACAEDVTVTKEKQYADEEREGFTCFTTEEPEETRTSMNRVGQFAWINKGDTVDHVWVIKDDTPILSESMEISSPDNSTAKFYLPGEFRADEYQVLYASSVVGEKPTEVPQVTIAEQQIQREPNNSEHFGFVGDCGIAKATKNGGKYTFKLEHQMAYIMFEPRIEEVTGNTNSALITRITVKETTGKNIRGTFELSGTGATLVDESTGGDQIEIICGEDVLPVENETMKAIDAKNYGFFINNTTYAPYGGTINMTARTRQTEDSKNGRIFMVIKPTTESEPYNLKVTYEYATSAVQSSTHDHEGDYGGNNWGIDHTYTNHSHDATFEITPMKNTWNVIRHKLPGVAASEPIRYKFNQYYMWGAKSWFWDGVENYPVHYNEYQSEGAPAPGKNSWYKDGAGSYATGDVCVGSFSQFRWVNRAEAANVRQKGIIRTGLRRTQADATPWSKALTANEMSFYVMYGDPYYDSEKEWILEEYNGVETICKGGVWIKKKDAIKTYLASINQGKSESEQYWWPNDNDATRSVYSAPFNSAKFRETAASLSYVEDDWLDVIDGQQYNLRYMAPPFNFRMPYTNWDNANNKFKDGIHKPSDDGKDIDDYFFIPCLGRFEYDNNQTTKSQTFSYWYEDSGAPAQKDTVMTNIAGTGLPTLTLVGSQGFYWTKTPVQFAFSGNTRFYKYVYDTQNPANLLSEYSDYDNYLISEEDVKGFLENPDNYPNKLITLNETARSVIAGALRYQNWQDYNDNAFYLNLHFHYIALSWQQHSRYVKTGMRIATKLGESETPTAGTVYFE